MDIKHTGSEDAYPNRIFLNQFPETEKSLRELIPQHLTPPAPRPAFSYGAMERLTSTYSHPLLIQFA
jgi:hypothetical protein